VRASSIIWLRKPASFAACVEMMNSIGLACAPCAVCSAEYSGYSGPTTCPASSRQKQIGLRPMAVFASADRARNFTPVSVQYSSFALSRMWMCAERSGFIRTIFAMSEKISDACSLESAAE
jgi:hypothetical protein